MTLHYEGRHRSQYATGASARLRSMGCTPTSLANALRCATGGQVDLSGDQVLALVAPAEETNPTSAGWSLEDAGLASSRISGAPPFAIRRAPWAEVVAALAAGYGVVLQGDSDQFPSGCSGAFDGDHAVFVHPDQVSGLQRLGDPICSTWRQESPTILQRYAEKLSGILVRFGICMTTIPSIGGDDMAGPTFTAESSTTGWVAATNVGVPVFDNYLSLTEDHRRRNTALEEAWLMAGWYRGNDGSRVLGRIGADGVSEFVRETDLAIQPAAPSQGTVDEAAIRADQRDKDRAEVGHRALP